MTNEKMREAFEAHEELREHIKRMASSGKVGNSWEWGNFLHCLNAAVARQPESHSSYAGTAYNNGGRQGGLHQPESGPDEQVPGVLLLTELNEECEQLQREIDRLKSRPAPQVPEALTCEMVSAGVAALEKSYTHEEAWSDTVRSVFSAMRSAAPSIAEPTPQMPKGWLTIAEQLFTLGREFWHSEKPVGSGGAVQWVRNDETGELFAYTRGEYVAELAAFIGSLSAAPSIVEKDHE